MNDDMSDQLLQAMYGAKPNNEFSKIISGGEVMDAKAKVVAWRNRLADGRWGYSHGATDPREVHDNGREYEPLVTLTDHEAALAELELSRKRWMRTAKELSGELTIAEQKHDALLTGLEALAGEWFERSSQHRIHTGNDSAAQLFANELTARIRTLTNSAKGETK